MKQNKHIHSRILYGTLENCGFMVVRIHKVFSFFDTGYEASLWSLSLLMPYKSPLPLTSCVLETCCISMNCVCVSGVKNQAKNK